MEHQQETQVRTPDDPETAGWHQDSAQPIRPQLHPVLQLQQVVGNRAVQRLLADGGTTVQLKLTVGATNDRYEREADRLAQQVVSMEPRLRADFSGVRLH